MILSIIIPHLKGKDILEECVQSIYDNIDSINFELIIVNNNSQDQSIDYIFKKFPDCKIINSKVNKGYAGGCNLGAKHALGQGKVPPSDRPSDLPRGPALDIYQDVCL